MGCYGGGLVLCTARHVRCNIASITHWQLMWTTLHPLKCLNLCKHSFYDCVGVKSQNKEIWKSWSWSGNLNKTVVRIRSGLFKMCWILPGSSPEIRILYTSGVYTVLVIWLWLDSSKSWFLPDSIWKKFSWLRLGGLVTLTQQKWLGNITAAILPYPQQLSCIVGSC